MFGSVKQSETMQVTLIRHVYVSQQIGIRLQVWMPDEPKTSSSSARSQSMRWNDTPSSPPSSASSSAAAVLAPDDTQSASTSGRQAGTGTGAQQGPPSWWDSPPTIHVDKRYKDQVRFCLSACVSVAAGTLPSLVPSSSGGIHSACNACSKSSGGIYSACNACSRIYMQQAAAQRHLAQVM